MSNSLKEIFKKLESFEKAQNVFEITIQGAPVWDYVRKKIFNRASYPNIKTGEGKPRLLNILSHILGSLFSLRHIFKSCDFVVCSASRRIREGDCLWSGGGISFDLSRFFFSYEAKPERA